MSGTVITLSTPPTPTSIWVLDMAASYKRVLPKARIGERQPAEVERRTARRRDLVDVLAVRSYPGWHHHMVISAVAYAFLQNERRRRGSADPLTFPAMRAIVQEVFTGLLFAARPVYVKWINRAQRNFPLRM